MPRKTRMIQLSKYYHIMCQGINKEYIFEKDLYKEKYLKIITEKSKKLNINIISYCVMNNHVHLIINSDKISNISKFMQRVNTTYSIFYNKKNERVGYVFRDRFLSRGIDDLRDLFVCIRYIHYNPIKADIVTRLQDYKYSSYNEFFEKSRIINEIVIREMFDTETNFRDYFNRIHEDKNGAKYNTVEREKIYEYIKDVEKVYKINRTEIWENKWLLKTVVQEARKRTNVSIRELAEILNVSKSTINNYLK